MNCEWYYVMIIKKGLYSILIYETIVLLFKDIEIFRLIQITKNDELESLFKTGGIFFMILIAGIVITFAIYYKNIILLILNFLFYLGFTLNFYTKDEKYDNMKGSAVGILNIIIVVFNFIIIAFMIIKYKEKLIES